LDGIGVEVTRVFPFAQKSMAGEHCPATGTSDGNGKYFVEVRLTWL
jgi:hypothetical protein